MKRLEMIKKISDAGIVAVIRANSKRGRSKNSRSS